MIIVSMNSATKLSSKYGLWGSNPPYTKQKKRIKKMAETKDIVKIKTYNDFVKQLQEIEKSNMDIVLSFYKYCSKQDDGMSYQAAKELIEEELEPLGLKPYRITKEMNLIFRFKKIAEAVVLIKTYGIDLVIHKR